MGQTYQEEIDYLKMWMADRLKWLDNHIPGNCITAGEEENILAVDNGITIYPNPFAVSTTIQLGKNIAIKNGFHISYDITKLAFSTRNDTLKAHILTALNGVNLPAASAILMFYDRKRFPVIDIRVWQQLHIAGYVATNQNGKGFKLKEWEKYLEVIRGFGTKHKLTARNVEKRIFDLDRKTRKGKLY